MASERKDKLVSLRLPLSHYNYLRSCAREKKITLSEFMRTIIEKDQKESGDNEPTLTEVTIYLRKLTDSQRGELLDKIEGSEKRKMAFFINDVISREPDIKGKKLCKVVSEELNLPVTLDLKRRVYLRLKSFRRKKKLVEGLENEY